MGACDSENSVSGGGTGAFPASVPDVVYRRYTNEASRDQARQRRTGSRPLVTGLRFGQAAPGFSLPSSAGGETSLADFMGKSDVVLVFYCYDWGGI